MALEKLKLYKQRFYLKNAVTFERVLSQTKVLIYNTFTKILKIFTK